MFRKVGLIILDGVGINPNKVGNAFALAKTPTLDHLLGNYSYCTVQTSGVAVGLPHGQPGNSEIGHLNIGAGRTLQSELSRINNDIENSQFIYNTNFQKTLQLVQKRHSKLHVIGLTSYGGVHSNLTHLLRILNICGTKGIKTVAHIIGDGRDVSIGSIAYDIQEIQNLDIEYGETVKIGTISGRYYAMDRDQNWDRTRKTIEAMIQTGPSYENMESYMAKCYSEDDATDEFIKPAYNKLAPDCKLEKDDVVLVFNFRQDRVRQLCHMFKKSKVFKEQSPVWDLNLALVTMVQYDGIDADLVLYPPQRPNNTLGEVIADAGLKQLRIAETEKYAHVTFFFDGGKEKDLPGEDKILIPSPKDVATYDLKPQMSALEVTDKLIENMDKYDFVLCNYANPDMVGHTGKLEPTIKAIETVDSCLAKVVARAREIGMTLFITSDHGNCDKMLDKGKPFTSHTTAPAFFICTDLSIRLHDGNLNNIAPTILKYMELTKPREMDKKPLY